MIQMSDESDIDDFDEDEDLPHCFGDYACGSEPCDFCFFEEMCAEECRI